MFATTLTNLRQLILVMLVAITALLTVTGCGSDSDGSPQSGLLQLVNGLNDTPTLAFEVRDSNGDVIGVENSFGFQQASALLVLPEGNYEVEFSFDDPGTGFEESLLISEIAVHADTINFGLLEGEFATASLRWLETAESDVTAVKAEGEDDLLELRALNLSSSTAAVYVGDASAAPAADNLVATVATGNFSDPVTFVYDEDAEYRIRLTADGSDDILFATNDVSFSPNSRSLVVVNDSVGPDSASQRVWLVRDNGALRQSNRLAQSGFHLINAVQDATDAAVTVTRTTSQAELFTATMTPNDVSAFTQVDSGFVHVDVVAPSTGTVSASVNVSMDPDTAYAVLLAGSSLVDDGVSIRANEIGLRKVANSVNIHIVNGLAEVDDVDFYALGDGETLSASSPIASRVGYLDGLSFVLPARRYDLLVTTAGTNAILAGPVSIQPQGLQRYVVTISEAVGGGTPYILELALQDD